MEIGLVHLLAEAGCSIDAAMEHTESGGTEWTWLLAVRSDIEKLIEFEVNNSWPQEGERK